MVQAWYPIDSGKRYPKETYIPSPVKGISNLATKFGLGQPFAKINQVDTQSYKGAPLSSKMAKYPVVLFSHGFGRARWEYQAITRELASHGYLVLSVEHTGFGLGTEFRDGRFIPFNPANATPDFDKMATDSICRKSLRSGTPSEERQPRVPCRPSPESRRPSTGRILRRPVRFDRAY